MLFDFATDAAEKVDLARQHPERVASLQQRYDAWAKDMVAPKWGAGSDDDK